MSSACPHCFVQLDPQLLAWECTGPCETVHDPAASALAGYEIVHKHITRVNLAGTGRRTPVPRTVGCERCGRETGWQVCPRCHHPLPEGWRQRRTVTVALAGARGSGKSVYIAALIETMRQYAAAGRRAFSALTPRIQNTYENVYRRPLYVEGRPMEATRRQAGSDAYQREPLIWVLGQTQESPEVTIIMRDVAGEDLENAHGGEHHLSFIRDADLVVFLFDPMAVRSIQRQLVGLVPMPDTNRIGVAPQTMLDIVLRLTGRSTRLALTVSKFDSLQALAGTDNEHGRILANPGAAFNRDDLMMRVGRGYSAPDTDLLDAEVSSLLQKLGASSMLAALDHAVVDRTRRAGTYRSFAVSALGAPPDHTRLNAHGISSFRCLDPVLWGLADKGIPV